MPITRSKALSIYRQTLKCIRSLPTTQRDKAMTEAQQRFKAQKIETNPEAIDAFWANAESRLSYLRISTGRKAPAPVAEAEEEGAGITRRFYHPDGTVSEVKVGVEKKGFLDNTRVLDEDRRRNQDLVERMHFRGKHWQGKPR